MLTGSGEGMQGSRHRQGQAAASGLGSVNSERLYCRQPLHTIDGLALCQVAVGRCGEKAVAIAANNALDVAAPPVSNAQSRYMLELLTHCSR